MLYFSRTSSPLEKAFKKAMNDNAYPTRLAIKAFEETIGHIPDQIEARHLLDAFRSDNHEFEPAPQNTPCCRC